MIRSSSLVFVFVLMMIRSIPARFRQPLGIRNIALKPLSSALDWKSSSILPTLVIVESPAKARTIQSYLEGKPFVVDFCAGHIRDLSKYVESMPHVENQVVCPELGIKVKSLGVDVFNGFEPLYIPMPGKTDVIRRLKMHAKNCGRIILATDEDREGEAISWHLTEVLKPKVPFKRAVFHEITKDAILKSFEDPRDIDMDIVRSQETRRILDRLAGYTVSPVLWRYIAPGMSAGRVQSCGLHSITERERSRWRFVPSSYCSLSALLDTSKESSGSPSSTILARLQAVNSKRVANDRDFDSATGAVNTAIADDLIILDESATTQLSEWLLGGVSKGDAHDTPVFTVSDVQSRKASFKAPLPFITSSLQQESSRKLGFSPSYTMSLAQGLYDSGDISYMRTDSPALSSSALEAARIMVTETFGASSLASSESASRSKKKDSAPKNAQEAHEAIRPAIKNGSFTPFYTFAQNDQQKLYNLILRRTLASVMAPSQSMTYTYTITVTAPSGAKVAKASSDLADGIYSAVFKSSDTAVMVPGFQAALSMHTKQGAFKAASSQSDSHARLQIGQKLQLSKRKDWKIFTGITGGDRDTSTDDRGVGEFEKTDSTIEADGLRTMRHHTRPPSRFTEAAFIQELEELGVGRPSTYSSILQTLKERGYIIVDRQTIVPTIKGMIVSAFLEKYFPQFVDAAFTAEMERNLDSIAHGECAKEEFLHRFYFQEASEISSAATGRAHVMKQGLLPTVTSLFTDGTANHTEIRRLEIPFLSDLGVINFNKNGANFEPYLPSADPIERVLSGKQFMLPESLQSDLRKISPDDLRTLAENGVPVSGEEIGMHPVLHLPVLFKTGQYGKYLQVGIVKKQIKFFSLPQWAKEDQLILDDALDFMSLPKALGMHPTLNASVLLDIHSGELTVSVQGFAARATLPSGVFVRDITLDTALSALPEGISVRGGLLGEYKGDTVSVCSGEYGPYLRCGNIVAPLRGQHGFTTANITLESAIHILDVAGKPLGSRSGKWKAAATSKGRKVTVATVTKTLKPVSVKATKVKAVTTQTADSVVKKEKKPTKKTTASTDIPVAAADEVTVSKDTKKEKPVKKVTSTIVRVKKTKPSQL